MKIHHFTTTVTTKVTGTFEVDDDVADDEVPGMIADEIKDFEESAEWTDFEAMEISDTTVNVATPTITSTETQVEETDE